jgi:sugar-specific transcriptional regulator TrmB
MLDLIPLKQFGLHNTDIKLYKAVLSLGRAKSGALIQESNLVSSSFYTSIAVLIEKGLVSYDVKNNVRWYKAQPPHAFIEKSKETTLTLQELAKEIAKIEPKNKQRNEIDVFVGHHGLQRAFLEHVENFKKGEKIRIIGFGSKAPQRKSLNNFLAEINAVASKKRSSMTILLDEAMRATKSSREFSKDKKTFFLPSSYFGPIAYNISQTEVLMSIWGSTPTVLRLRNKIMLQSLTTNFDFLVSHAKR